MSLGTRIKSIRGKTSQKEFCSEFSITPNTLRGYETDSTPPNTDFIIAICGRYGLNPSWLLTGEGEMYKGTSPGKVTEGRKSAQDDFDYIPMAKATLSAGGGAFVLSEDFEGYYAFRKNWINSITTSKKDLVLLRVEGDSMHPTIQNKDTVMIDASRCQIKEGQIYALRADHTIMIKRLSFRLNDKIQIISDNKQAFEPYEVNVSDIHILGQVIFFSRVLIAEQ